MTAAAAVWIGLGGALPKLRTMPRLSTGDGAAALLASSVVFILAVSASGSMVVAGAVALLSIIVMIGASASRRQRGRDAELERWPEVLAILQSRLAGGGALPDSLAESLLATGGPFESAGDTLRQRLGAGQDFTNALQGLRSDLAGGLTDQVVTMIGLAHRSGGATVADHLQELAVAVADQLQVESAHQAATTQQRVTATVALLAPWALLLLTLLGNPQAREAYATPTGHTLVAVGLAATLVGFAIARRIAALRRRPRVFS